MKTSKLRLYVGDTFIREQDVTEEQVLAAIKQYDREYPLNDYVSPGRKITWWEDDTHDYAIRYQGTCYPPKYILRLAIAPDRPDKLHGFKGGGGSGNANEVLRELDFEIIRKSECSRSL